MSIQTVATTLGDLAASQAVLTGKLRADLDTYGAGQHVTARKQVTAFGTYLLGWTITAQRVTGSAAAEHSALYAALRADGHNVALWQDDPADLRTYAEAVGFDMYAAIAAYYHAHGWHAAVDTFGEPYVRAAMLPTD